MDVVRIAAVAGLLLAAGTAEAQKNLPGGGTQDGGGGTQGTGTVAPDSLLWASDPAGLTAAFQELGYQATLTTDSEGKPMIDVIVDGITTSVLFYGCQGTQDCSRILLYVGLDMTNGTNPQVIADWNFNEMLGTGYQNADKDPFLSYYLVMDGGVTRESFRGLLLDWFSAVDRFTETVGF
jgi:hypothetical protein